MNILSNTRYLITCHFAPDGCEGLQHFFGTIEELQNTIRSTWSKIPHRIIIVHSTVQVQKAGEDPLLKSSVLANFTFTSLSGEALPDHF